jgi:hypothetical protein
MHLAPIRLQCEHQGDASVKSQFERANRFAQVPFVVAIEALVS